MKRLIDKDALVAEIERLIDRKDPNTYLGVLKIEAYKDVLSIIDSMQKEPKFKVGDKVRYKYNNICTKPMIIAEICGLSHYVDTDNHRMDMAYTDVNFELVEEPKKCMYSKDDYTDEDRKVLCNGCEEECKYSHSVNVPFDSKNYEFIEATYYIPKGMCAIIEDDKVIIKKK